MYYKFTVLVNLIGGEWINVNNIVGLSGSLGEYDLDDLDVYQNVSTDNTNYYFPMVKMDQYIMEL